MKPYKKLNVLILPTDACNMNCIYCFHLKNHKYFDKMQIETIKQFYDITFPNYEEVNIIWHGGEPLLMGLDFFNQAIELQNKYKAVSKITNSIQTNLTLMTDEFANFFHKNNISVSSSYDGILNDKTRSFSQEIINRREKIIRTGMECGFIMIATSINIHTLIDSYKFFKQRKIGYRINLYVGSSEDKLSLNPEIALKELANFFNYYVQDESCEISIELFVKFLSYFKTKKTSSCENTSCLGRWVGIRHDGSITPCNRYFPKEYLYGNISDYSDISQAFDSEGFKHLLTKAVERRKKCKECEIFDFCSGGCNNIHLNETGIENMGGNTCVITKALFHYLEDWYQNLNMDNFNGQIKNPLILSKLKTKEVTL